MTKNSTGLRDIRRLTTKVFLAQRRDHVLLKVRRALKLPETMTVGATELTLSPGHTLTMNQRHHVLYDRFLPHLAARLKPNSMVIDVGANCGDTLGAMHATNPTLGFIAIEPHDEYFALLERNVARLKAKSPFEVHLVKRMVSCSAGVMTLVQSGGTARAVHDPDAPAGAATQKLDEIVEAAAVTSVRLLKSDVDGFDFDVLNSAQSVLARMQPVVFFESQIDYEFQRIAFAEMLSMLEGHGYNFWVLFDNFGSVVLRTSSRDAVAQLIDYTWKKRHQTPWRTINYFDVLAVTQADRDFANEVVDSYETLSVA